MKCLLEKDLRMAVPVDKVGCMKIVIPGDPIPKARHRSCVRGGHVMQYDLQGREKDAVGCLIWSKFLSDFDSDEASIRKEAWDLSACEAMEIDFTFYMPIPGSFSQKKRLRAELGIDLHVKKPDVDNLVKFYMDCMIGRVVVDDSKVCKISACKRYGEPRTEIHLKVLRMENDMKDMDKILGVMTLSDLYYLGEMVRGREVTFKRAYRESILMKEDLEELAGIASWIADKYGDKLIKIKKSFPAYWEIMLSSEKTGYDHAIEEREEQEDHSGEHPYGDGNETTEASGSDSAKCSEEVGSENT